tara:strand:- start:1687 stop:3759 length:2073 start_codon:yes stop_codon:yes gene_type:complete
MVDTAKDIQGVAHTFDNLTDSIQKAATTSGKLRDTFLQLSKTTTSSGQAWTVLSRLSSGSGFWKIQNRIRSISNFLQYQDYKAQEMAKHEKEAIANLGEQMKLKKDIQNASKVLSAVSSDTASTEERVMFYQSEQFKYLEQMYGRQEAMVKMTDKLKYASEQLAITDKSMLDNRVNQHKKMLEKGLGFKALFLGQDEEHTDYQRFMNLNNENQRTFMQYADATDKLQGLKNDKLKIEQELFDELHTLHIKDAELNATALESAAKFAEYNDAMKDGSGKTVAEKEKLLLEREELEREKSKLTSERDRIQEETERIDKSLIEKEKDLLKNDEEILKRKDKLNSQGISVSNTTGTAELDMNTDKESFGKRMMEKLGGFIDKFPGGSAILGLFRGAKLFFLMTAAERKKAVGDVLLKIAKPLFMVLRGFLIYFPLVLLLLYALKQSGWLDVILELIRGIGMWISIVWEGLVEFFVNVSIFFGSLITLFDAIFNGSTSEVRTAMLESVTALFWMVEKFLYLILIDVFGTLILGGIAHIVTTIADKYMGDGVISGIFTIAKDVLSAFVAWAAFDRMMKISGMTIWGALAIGIAAFIGADAGAGFIGKSAGVKGYADGGLVNKSGSYLVGERGPEIVSMKGGSYVTPNHQLGGSTTINVSVNGRIGASDSELNDIANKLSNIINQRMQRAGTSGVFR